MNLKLQPSPWVDLLLLFVALIWGTSYVLTKQSLEWVSVFVFISLRFSFTFLCLLPFVWKELRSVALPILGKSIILGGLLFGIFTFEVNGVFYTSASNAAVLISLCILFTPIIERFVLKTNWSPSLNWAIPLSLVGICLLTLEKSFSYSISIGDLLILVAAVLRAVAVVTTKKYVHGNFLSPLAFTCVQFGTVALLAFFVSHLLGEAWIIPLHWEFWGAQVYLVVFCTLIAFAAKNYSLTRVSASRAAFLMGTEPLFGLLFAVMILNENLTISGAIGAMLVVGATYGVLHSPDGKTSANTNPSRSTTSPT
jgi:drug/metabolite transporter (DMT)-like permease